MKDKPTIIVKIKGDAGKYTVWGIDWLNHKMLIERSCGYEQVPFEKITIIESELAQLKAKAEKEVSEPESNIVTVHQRVIEILLDDTFSGHPSRESDYQIRNAIKFLGLQIDKLHELRFKAHRDSLTPLKK